MDYISLFFGIIFIAAGIIFAFGKVYHYLPAWEKMPDTEKEKIKIAPLCRNIGGMVALNGMIFLLRGFIVGFSEQIFTGAIIVWMVIAGLDVYYISKSHR